MSVATVSDSVLRGLRDDLDDLEALYKDIHSHPELSMQEKRTAGLAAERLKTAGFEVTEGVGQTGVVGLLKNGDGPTVMLRADMDALPVKEATGLPYASTVTAADADGNETPVMHACGHDIHVTWIAAAAKVLAEAVDRLAAPDDRLAGGWAVGCRRRHRQSATGWDQGERDPRRCSDQAQCPDVRRGGPASIPTPTRRPSARAS
jgi:hypothetical protein